VHAALKTHKEAAQEDQSTADSASSAEVLTSLPKQQKALSAKPAKSETQHKSTMCNHLENNYHLSNKKALYYNLKTYYESTEQQWYDKMPLTFHIQEGVSDKEFQRFSAVFRLEDLQVLDGVRYQAMGKSLWIVKPGENTNQGCGIQVCKDLQSIREIISNTKINGNKRSYIIQKYIEKPLLYRNRKFDIRCYFLLTS